MAAFEHQERLRLSLISPQHVNVELETTSSLRCSELKQCLTIVSPFRSDVLQLVVSDYPELKSLRWESSSQSSNTLSFLSSRHSSPSGVSVHIELEDGASSSDSSIATVMKLLQRLQDDRLLMAPMGSITQKRLHRYVLPKNRNNETSSYRINLPMEGTAVTSEAFQAYLPPNTGCGIWGVGTADAWSSVMLGYRPNMAHSKRSMWMDMSKICRAGDDECEIILKQGIHYGRRWNGVTGLSLNEVLPGSRFSPCPWTDESIVEVTTLKSISATVTTDRINVQDTDLLRTTTHALPLSLSDPFLQVQDSSSSSWSGDVSYVRLDKTILRPLGMAYVGSLQTTVTNDDIYEARISLYDILPSYIRPTMIDLSLTNDASRSYQPLDTSMLLQHDFILPSQSSARLTIDYDPVLLPFQQFPSDPNRGIEVPPSWAVWNGTAATTTDASTVLYSQSLLLLPPVPDMSMPFNIISLTCTLYAFVIGSIINTIVRRSEDRIYYQLYPDKKPKAAGQKLKEKLRKIKEKLLGCKVQPEDIKVKNEDKPVEDDWVPEANLEEDGSEISYLLTQLQRQTLAIKAFPTSVADRRWKRLYSLERDGDSFESFLDKVIGEAPTLIVVKTTSGHIFGGYADHEWKRKKDYYGSGQAFLFQLSDDETGSVVVYNWTGANHSVQHIDGNKSRIIMGAGDTGGLGLCVEDNFCRGSTSRCETFDNEPLCPDGVFDVVSFEVYGFVRGSF